MGNIIYGHISFGPAPYKQGMGPCIEDVVIAPTGIVTWTDKWECTHQVSIAEAARMLKEFYDNDPRGGLTQLEGKSGFAQPVVSDAEAKERGE
jgi:hypothetical protein